MASHQIQQEREAFLRVSALTLLSNVGFWRAKAFRLHATDGRSRLLFAVSGMILECRLSDQKADVANSSKEQPFMAEGGRSPPLTSNGSLGSGPDQPSPSSDRRELGAEQSKSAQRLTFARGIPELRVKRTRLPAPSKVAVKPYPVIPALQAPRRFRHRRPLIFEEDS